MSDSQVTVPIQTVAPPRQARGRAITSVICLVLAALLTTPAAFAYWGQRTLNDSQRYVDTVGPLVKSPEVQAAIATTVTDAIQQQVDVESIINNVFSGVITSRPRLQQLVGPLAAAVNGLIARQVQEFVASQTFEDLWVAANERAQQAFQRILNGDNSGAVSLKGDQVVLDVSTVIDQVKAQLVARGLTFVANAPVPAVDRQIVLLDAPQLKQVKTIYAFSNPVAKWLILVVALLYVAGFLLARRRPRATVVIGVLLAANALLVALLLSIGRQLFVNELAGTVFGPASTVFYDQLLTYLVRGRKVLLWLGLILVVVGWYTSSNRAGVAVRQTVTGSLENGGAALPQAQVGGAARWVAANARWLRIVAGLIGVVILFWGNQVSPGRLAWAVVVVAVLLAAIQALVGAGRGAGPAVAAPPSDIEQLAPPTGQA